MESKNRLVLKHKKTGLYYGNNAALTKELWSAWRFYDMEYIIAWLSVANFAPKDPENYDIIQVEVTIEEVPFDV